MKIKASYDKVKKPKLTFDALPDGTVFRVGTKTYQRVKAGGNSTTRYAIDLAIGKFVYPTLQSNTVVDEIFPNAELVLNKGVKNE